MNNSLQFERRICIGQGCGLLFLRRVGSLDRYCDHCHRAQELITAPKRVHVPGKLDQMSTYMRHRESVLQKSRMRYAERKARRVALAAGVAA